jgi:hypothetical protein
MGRKNEGGDKAGRFSRVKKNGTSLSGEWLRKN